MDSNQDIIPILSSVGVDLSPNPTSKSGVKNLEDTLQAVVKSKENLKVFFARSGTLLERIHSTVDLVKPIMSASGGDRNIKVNIMVLYVLVEEVDVYLKMLSSYSRDMAELLAKYGLDEEVFSKWNERLQFVLVALSANVKIDIMFDKQVDEQDLKTDRLHLQKHITLITDNLIFAEAIMKKLIIQESLTYKTLTVPTNSVVIDPSSLVYEAVIGSGTFGTVWKASLASNLVAVKMMICGSLSEAEKDALKMEADIMRKLSHPRIVACLGVFEADSKYCMVLEFCPCGSLASLIAKSPPISFFNILDLALDIAVGMDYLHRLNVLHRDLKPGNVVLDQFMRA